MSELETELLPITELQVIATLKKIESGFSLRNLTLSYLLEVTSICLWHLSLTW